MRGFDRSLLADLTVFVTIVRRHSMRQAAIELGVTTSALSHRMRKLEADLGVRLLNRTSRSLTPTEAGAALAQRLELGLQTIEDSLGMLARHRNVPSGHLRINAPKDASRLLLGPILPRYLAEFPEMHLDITVDDHLVDVVAEGFDAGIRYGDRVPQDMIGVTLSKPLQWVVAGAPALIARVGVPMVPDDLLSRPCIEMRVGDNSRYPWELGNGDALRRLDVRGALCTNETQHAMDAALGGVGFFYCLEELLKPLIAEGRLQVVLPGWASEGAPLTIYYPSRRQVPPGLHELIAMIRVEQGLPRLAIGGGKAEEVPPETTTAPSHG
ncbi:LysR family transcriptional regulator [Oceanicella sp. SM1341]|uniref:LysR family transcriptional regulator n=1 Tax=Oceanicella sp. SM1341 TaxID=1548889 RepID=UPI000E4D17A0|nr:LysR family transcriptional regulator [Oceanicella sp. SM1341]